MLGLVLPGGKLRGETPIILPAVHDINVYSARPDGQFQLCRVEVGAVHPAGIKEPGRHCRPDTNVTSGGGVKADLPAHTEQLP